MRSLTLALVVLAAAACGEGSSDAGGTTTNSTTSSTGGAASGGGGMGGATGGGGAAPSPPRVLLFSKTEAFRHDSIPAAADALSAIGQRRDWEVSHSEDATLFDAASLSAFDVVVFLMTSGDILDDAQQAALEGFVQQGGGWVGVHSASDTEYDWPWFGELVGAYFGGHPAIQQATVRIERPSHAAALPLGLSSSMAVPTWVRNDEWYSFVTNPRADVQVLMSLDETSYDPAGFAMGDHPIAWYRGFDGGRSFYTAMGHTDESYADAQFVSHVAGGIEWAAGHRATPVVLAELDGTPPGTWDVHGPDDFPFEVTADGLNMTDLAGANQHVVRRDVQLDFGRPYVVEALFSLAAPLEGGLNSFCLNVAVGGAEDDLTPPSTWAINVDLSPSGGGVMKHMGFTDGQFQAIGETPVTWGAGGEEYLLRIGVHLDSAGAPSPNRVAATVLRDGVVLEQFDVDYAAFPYQPSGTIRIGANTHGSDWTMRGLRAYYAD
jgi:type 1 glutamine amidotransferase